MIILFSAPKIVYHHTERFLTVYDSLRFPSRQDYHHITHTVRFFGNNFKAIFSQNFCFFALMSLFIPFIIAFLKSNFKEKNSDEIVHFAYFDGLGQIFKNWLLHFQKLWQLWHCPQNWQKRFHLQSIRTKMSDNDETIVLLPKVHDLWPSHGMYPTLHKRSLEKLSKLCWWQ